MHCSKGSPKTVWLASCDKDLCLQSDDWYRALQQGMMMQCSIQIRMRAAMQQCELWKKCVICLEWQLMRTLFLFTQMFVTHNNVHGLTSRPAAENVLNASHLECLGRKKALGFNFFNNSFPITKNICFFSTTACLLLLLLPMPSLLLPPPPLTDVTLSIIPEDSNHSRKCLP